jgi:polar amino acid transport system substrate-binding protein/glutamate/aspartate transport system substrate-binding protein
MSRLTHLVGLITLLQTTLLVSLTTPSFADTLGSIKESKVLRLAVREDAPPFSSKNADGRYVGYSVALCQAIANALKKQLSIADLKIEYVPVTASDRFDIMTGHKADILCEATSATLTRREAIDFSIPTFVSGTGLVIREGGPMDMKSLTGKKLGVLGGTTAEEALRRTLKDQKISATIVPAVSHEEGMSALEKQEVEAYFADRTILQYWLATRKSPQKFLLAEEYLTIEPYALGLPGNDPTFRLAVDRELSRMYRSGAVIKLFRGAFGEKAKPTNLLKALYTISGLPE